MSVIASPLSDGDRVVARSVVEPESDWRPLPSCAEVLAHNARTGGDCFGPWLCVEDPADEHCVARVVPLAVSLAFGGEHDEVCSEPDITPRLANPAARFRPITRRGGALPWPEVSR